ncbi:PqqD family peptide modification chaperone [Tabrizicola flagellatus]|uniref:PqqD family peptide modification chaperone n=1 Tax=Tabrizicola flagellatus TaxID=2593021 RepID=UPI001356D683|nr:PqqD family protein [Tabrizicola flagellatus]
MHQYVTFRGLRAPLRLEAADEVLSLLPQVFAGWPLEARTGEAGAAPFFSIGVGEDGLLACESHVDDRPVRRFDAVNAVCDAVSAIAFALPAEDDRLICLHAAAVEMAGRLVVFPNVRRAGKSTLSSALARAGHPLFSDDVLPLSFTTDDLAWGLAMGIAPRLRLPLPGTIDPFFRAWVDSVGGPKNRQYQYLCLPDQPAHGVVRPLGAFVILDRRDDRTLPRLEPVSPDAAMDALLHQNFTRDRHSGDVLLAMASVLALRPVFRLTYEDLSEAVACLEQAFEGWPDDLPSEPVSPDRHFRLAEFGAQRMADRGIRGRVRQRAGTVAAEIGGTLYLADAEGQAIHRMDAMAALIWELLADPALPEDIVADLAEAFPDTPRARIAADLEALIDRLAREALIDPDTEG